MEGKLVLLLPPPLGCQAPIFSGHLSDFCSPWDASWQYHNHHSDNANSYFTLQRKLLPSLLTMGMFFQLRSPQAIPPLSSPHSCSPIKAWDKGRRGACDCSFSSLDMNSKLTAGHQFGNVQGRLRR